MERADIVAAINSQIEVAIINGTDPAAVFEDMVGLLCECGDAESEREFLIYLGQLAKLTVQLLRDRMELIRKDGKYRDLTGLASDSLAAAFELIRLRYALWRHSRTGGSQVPAVQCVLSRLRLRLPFRLVESAAH